MTPAEREELKTVLLRIAADPDTTALRQVVEFAQLLAKPPLEHTDWSLCTGDQFTCPITIGHDHP